MKPRITIRRARSSDESAVAKLFRSYFRSIRAQVGAQNATAAATFYLRAPAAVWLARVNGTPAGCSAVRPLGRSACELKHLFVLPRYQAMHLGRRLVRAAHRHARATGRTAVYLDTLESMTAAQALYVREGYVVCAPYHDDTIHKIFMRKRLNSRR